MKETKTGDTEVLSISAELNIYQDVDLSLTEQVISPVVHVKQFDHKARKVRCHLYSNSVEYSVPKDVILSYSGTRPDGSVFQYSNESAKEKIFLEGNAVVIVITDFMTMQHGRFPVDIILLDDDGEVLGAFSLTLKVERAAVSNRKIATATYAGVAYAIGKGIYECFTTEEGYFGIRSEDGLGLSAGSESSTVERIKGELVTCSITDNGYLAFDTDEKIGLSFGTDAEGRLVVGYNEED